MWKKQAGLALLICVTVALLCGCAQEQTTYPEAASAPTREPVRQADVLSQPTDVPEPVISFPDDYGDVDEGLADDEDLGEDEQNWEEEEETPAGPQLPTRAPAGNSKYAGATPIPLDPVDMPTPTPHPDLEFEYEEYTTALGYTLQVPVGWLVEQDDGSSFVIRDPNMYENVNAQFSLTSQSVSSSYRVSDLRTELSNQLSQIQRNYVGWRIWTPDSRQLLKSDGVYNAYRGVAYDGTIVRGLVHVALVGQRVVTLSFSAPGNFNNSYQRVYNKMRNTIQ